MLFYQAQQSHQPLSVHRNHICTFKRTYAIYIWRRAIYNPTILNEEIQVRRDSNVYTQEKECYCITSSDRRRCITSIIVLWLAMFNETHASENEYLKLQWTAKATLFSMQYNLTTHAQHVMCWLWNGILLIRGDSY